MFLSNNSALEIIKNTKHSYFVSSLKNLIGTFNYLLFPHKISVRIVALGEKSVTLVNTRCFLLKFKAG